MEIRVHETKDFEKFKFMGGNREVNPAHVARIKKSYEEDGPKFNVLIVNERNEIIDGQHRFLVHKALDLPFHFVIKRNYGLDEVHVYNQNTANWTLTEFMRSYCKMGYRSYQEYQVFKSKYPFSHGECVVLLSGSFSNKTQVGLFKAGKFRISNWGRAVKTADQIMDFAQWYDGYTRHPFVLAAIKMMWNVKEYDHQQMLQKLSYQSGRLQDQPNTRAYLMVLEDIYNYKTRSGSPRVRFDLAA